jgi:outer membrane protein OmpA-like peptidoglycan-associated protein
MKPRIPNAALAILLSGASIVAPALAQDNTKPTPGAALQYVGADTRLGIGIDSENNVRGELFQVLRSNANSATLGEIWASRDAGGLKLSHHWTANTSAVNKVFIAVDQGENDMRKATVGGGQEYEKWFWNASLSKSLSGARLVSTASIANTVTQTGSDAGRPFEQDVITTVTSRGFERAYDWGVGARAGHFYESALVRVTAGLDYEWGKYSSRQWTGSLVAEKFFAGSPISVALSGELNRRSGDFEGTKNDRRGFVMLRYELGAPQTSFKPNKVTRMVTATERVPDPNWKPPVATGQTQPAGAAAAAAAKPAEPTTRLEKRVTRANANDAQETYFDLGSARLKPAALKELDALVSRIAAQRPYVELKVNVVGHTCPTGSDRNNFALSGKRAAAVKAYLVSKGVPENLVSTDAKAGKAPKYPEVKGQSFRNRRADTDVIIVKEKVEEVRVPVAATVATTPPAGTASPANPAAPQVSPPMIDRQVQREVVEDVPNNWISRALHNPAQHKTSVDSYRWVEASTEQTTGPRRYINRGPAAVNDSYTIDCNAPTTFNVLANDTDPDGDTLTITGVSAPGKGTAVISSGKIVYTPNAASCAGGTDSFTYNISDGKGGTSTATVNVTVRSSNNAPVAVNDIYVVPCKTTAVLDVLANDSDRDGDALTITSITQPSRAVISIGANGKSLVYTPGASCFVSDSFTYTISDGKGGTATASVTLVDP